MGAGAGERDAVPAVPNMADEVFDLAAGPERSVAATKSFIASLAAIARIVAEWSDDDALRSRSARAPRYWPRPGSSTGPRWCDALEDATDLYVLGRGVGFAAAQEAALKLKETSQLHAEPSAPPSFATGRWRWSARAFRR